MKGKNVEKHESATVAVRQYLRFLQRWLWVVVLGTLVAASAALFASRRSTPVYEACTTLLISEGQRATGPDYNAILMSERLARTYTELLKGSSVLSEAASRLGGSLGYAELSAMVKADIVRDTQLIRLRVRHPDPALAAKTADTVPRVFIEQNQRREAERLAGSQQNLSRELAASQKGIASAQSALDLERSKLAPDAAEVARLDALLAQYRSSYASVLQSYEEIHLAEARRLDSVSVVEPAQVPLKPVSPHTLLNAMLGGVVGGMLAAAAAFLVEYLDDTIKGAEDVGRVADLPVFATIGRFPRHRSHAPEPLLAVSRKSPVAEAYRVLRTNLQFASPSTGGPAVTLLVTSAQPLEGKTTTLANLGASLAQSGKRVLLVDADLRRPSLHKYFGLKNDCGLASLLLHQYKDPQQIVQKTSIPRLLALTAGHALRNPAEALGFPETQAVFAQLRSMVDYVIVDSPPVLSVTDALILAQKVDGVLLVVEAGRTRRDVLRGAAASLQSVKAPILGVVLNKVRVRRGSYYYGNYRYGPDRERQTARSSGRWVPRFPSLSWIKGVGRGMQRLFKRGTKPHDTGA